ncbi:acetylcholine receptor subunit alpha-like isoform X2 [Lineus longissimus]
MNHESRLINDLTNTSVYWKFGRPVRDISKAVIVKLRLALVTFQLESTTEKLNFFGNVWMKWNDEYLRWNESDYGGLRSILLRADSVWLPDTAINNRIDGRGLFTMEKNDMIMVKSDGSATFAPGGVFEVQCPTYMARFPFDEQNCVIYIGSEHYDMSKLRIFKDSDKDIQTNITENGAWSIISIEDDVVNYTMPCDIPSLGCYQYVKITLHLRRKPAYFILNILIPCVAISLLVLMVFFVPCESGEKISLSISTLVALTVFQMAIVGDIPKTTTETPVIVHGLTALTTISTLSTISTVFILKFFYMPRDVAMPRWFHAIVFRILNRITCFTEASATNGCKSCDAPAMKPLQTAPTSTETDGTHSAISHESKMDKCDHHDDWITAVRIIDRFLLYIFVCSWSILIMICIVLMSF